MQMILRRYLFNSTVFAQMDPSVMQMSVTARSPGNIQMATIVVIMLPIMCIYPLSRIFRRRRYGRRRKGLMNKNVQVRLNP